MAAVVRYTIDTSFIVKGLVPPRRKKEDEMLEQQKKMYSLARSYLDKVRDKEMEIYIPAITLVETAIVQGYVCKNCSPTKSQRT